MPPYPQWQICNRRPLLNMAGQDQLSLQPRAQTHGHPYLYRSRRITRVGMGDDDGRRNRRLIVATDGGKNGHNKRGYRERVVRCRRHRHSMRLVGEIAVRRMTQLFRLPGRARRLEKT